MSRRQPAKKQVLDVCLFRDVLDGNLRSGKQAVTPLSRRTALTGTLARDPERKHWLLQGTAKENHRWCQHFFARPPTAQEAKPTSRFQA